ncbi:MAG: hypothetical protein Q7T56_18535 [Nocardioidaceae bacterium]|nr:hypothetical protein [Nocardioidaceae bacterium]
MTHTVEPEHRPSSPVTDDDDGDPAIVLVHPLREPSAELSLTVTLDQTARLQELLTSRSVASQVVPARDDGGLTEVRVSVGDDARAVDDVADCLQILLQMLGRAVFGPLSNPALLDVARQGRDVVAAEVARTFAPLRPFLPA